MIERTEVEGRKATVAYLKNDFTPAEAGEHDLVKIIFDDGEIRFATPVRRDGDKEED